MSSAYTVAVSRMFCASLCLRSGSLQPVDMALWLAAVSGALILVDEPDADGVTMRDFWRVAEDDAAPLYIEASSLLRATGLRGHGMTVRPFERLAEAEVSLGRDGPARHQLWHGWEADPVSRDHPVDRGIVSGMVLSMAMVEGDPFPVSVNLSALAAFRCRYSTIVYLRALAWLNGIGTPKAWGRTKPGNRVTVTVPLSDIAKALGTDSPEMVGDWNALAFGREGRGGPVHADLATAGIRLETEWQTASVGYGARRVPSALRITVARIRGAERRPLRRRPRQSSRSSSSSASSMP